MKSKVARREAVIRAKNKVKRRMRDIWGKLTWGLQEDSTKNPKLVGRLANTPKPCSGACCGNPRHHYKGKGKLTMQELSQKFIEKAEDCEW